MSRQRFIHPEIWNSDQFTGLSHLARLLFIGLFSTSDDDGRRKGSLNSIRGDIFPRDGALLTDTQLSEALREVCESRIGSGEHPLVRVYEVGGVQYLDLPAWNRYQKPQWRKPSKFPPYADNRGLTTTDVRTYNDQCKAYNTGREGKGSGVVGRGGEGPGGAGRRDLDSPQPPASQIRAPGSETSPESEVREGGKDEAPRSLREIIDRANGGKRRRQDPKGPDREERIAELRRQAAQILEEGPKQEACEDDLSGFEPPPVDIAGES